MDFYHGTLFLIQTNDTAVINTHVDIVILASTLNISLYLSYNVKYSFSVVLL